MHTLYIHKPTKYPILYTNFILTMPAHQTAQLQQEMLLVLTISEINLNMC